MAQVCGEEPKLESTVIHTNTLQNLPSPLDLFKHFVQPRRPVLLQGCAAAFLENPDIMQQLGDVSKILAVVEGDTDKTVEVNQVSNSSSTPSSFSPQSGSIVTAMSFKEFCEKLSSGSADYYMTTQTLPTDDEGRPAVTNWLTERLLREEILPLRPASAGKLIPMNVGNLWMGHTSTTTPSSSGLHHDFHDNFYCLVAGTKRIRLAPPSCVHHFTMVGNLHTLHSNGRMVYQEQIEDAGHASGACPIRPDGALVSVERIVQLEMRKEEIEGKLEAETSEEKKEQLEEELNGVEEELLDIEMVGDGTDRSSNAESDCDSNAESDNEDPGMLFHAGSKRTKRESPEGDTKRVKTNEKGDNQTRVPPNFVRQTPSDERSHFQDIQMKAGDVLYLPAGWFHEVFSAGLHMAVNYWLHPPDTGSTFEAPYKSQFWQRDWDARRLS